jgi:hypothetical protein
LIRVFGTGFPPPVPLSAVRVSVGFADAAIVEALAARNETPGRTEFLIRVPRLPDNVKSADVSFSTANVMFEQNGSEVFCLPAFRVLLPLHLHAVEILTWCHKPIASYGE